MALIILLLILFLPTICTLAIPVEGAGRNCRCLRLPNETSIGYDVSHWTLMADVGRCAKLCQGRNGLSLNSSGADCVPVEVQSESFPLLGSDRYADSIHKCGRASGGRHCHLAPLHKIFFNGTKYNRRVNMGICRGGCARNEHKCQPIDTRHIAVEGPNGKGELRVPVVQECGCVRARCHRVAFREVFKRRGEQGEWKEEEVDVGMCVGKPCPRSCFPIPCASKFSCGEYCLDYTPKCQASRFTTEHVWTGDFKPKKIQIIHKCSCQ